MNGIRDRSCSVHAVVLVVVFYSLRNFLWYTAFLPIFSTFIFLLAIHFRLSYDDDDAVLHIDRRFQRSHPLDQIVSFIWLIGIA